jgi:catalase
LWCICQLQTHSFSGPKADPAYVELPLKISGDADRYDQKRGVDDDHVQPDNLFRLMPADEQKRLIQNITNSLKNVSKEMQEKM